MAARNLLSVLFYATDLKSKKQSKMSTTFVRVCLKIMGETDRLIAVGIRDKRFDGFDYPAAPSLSGGDPEVWLVRAVSSPTCSLLQSETWRQPHLELRTQLGCASSFGWAVGAQSSPSSGPNPSSSPGSYLALKAPPGRLGGFCLVRSALLLRATLLVGRRTTLAI